MSRPARARGLKPWGLVLLIVNRKSRPARARGLKHTVWRRHDSVARVAPRAGAWIETRTISSWALTVRVAPRAGAWIETLNMNQFVINQNVAPRAGAWIETFIRDIFITER